MPVSWRLTRSLRSADQPGQLEEETGGFNRVSYHDSAFPPSLLPPSQPSQGLSQEKLSRYESSPEPPSKIRGILKNGKQRVRLEDIER